MGSIEIISRWRLANRPQPQDNQVVDVPAVPAVRAAKLTGVFDCRWTGSFHPPLNEVLDVNDYINLASGLAEVTYDSGAKVLLQGPCTYKIESPSSGYLKVGRLTARVKGNEERGTKKEELPAPTSSLLLPTSSFVVNTPTATVTDLGTEFGVDVDGAGATDSLVFVGSVKVNTVVGDGQKQAGEVTLIENQSARVERQGGKQYVVRRDVVKPEGFVRPDHIQDWLAMAREAAAKRKAEAEKPKEPEPDLTQFHRWEAFSNELRQRDDLLAYYDFQYDPTDKRDSENHELLRNKAKTAPGIFGRNYDGQLWGSVNMGMIEGRFPGKTALKSDCNGDAVRINIPIECRQMTLAAWVRFEQPPKELAALLMSDGWNEPGKMCWALGKAGSMKFAYFDGKNSRACESPPAVRVDPASLGQWQLLAIALDQDAESMVFYADGEPIDRQALPSATPSPLFALNKATIMAWNPLQIAGDERPLMGTMDELMIFNKSLPAEEIRRMYEEGKPTIENPKTKEAATDNHALLQE